MKLARRAALAVHYALVELAHEFDFDSDLKGACEGGSRALVSVLRKLGYNPVFVIGEYRYRTPSGWWTGSPHAWVELDGQILDVTASQFGFKMCVYTPRGRARSRYREEARGRAGIRFMGENWGPYCLSDSKVQRIVRRAMRELGDFLLTKQAA